MYLQVLGSLVEPSFTIDGTRKEHMELLASVPLLIIDDLGMRKLPVTAAEELLEIGTAGDRDASL
jgi:DNA replication protein DnaC